MENKEIIDEKKDTKEYSKEYYAKNKVKMVKQIMEAKKVNINVGRNKLKILTKLNNGEYKRIPMAMLKKYDIVFNVELLKYI